MPITFVSETSRLSIEARINPYLSIFLVHFRSSRRYFFKHRQPLCQNKHSERSRGFYVTWAMNAFRKPGRSCYGVALHRKSFTFSGSCPTCSIATKRVHDRERETKRKREREKDRKKKETRRGVFQSEIFACPRVNSVRLMPLSKC